ncbi:Gaa1-like protein [Crepidotus variabilis]|uniref:Gaa1-like protein n=1 Tax=Crepidotus variabilis TaxID=179855 RepID=A0A9P6JNC1_9AGAR|nr:Gaa1-like protein [Crepidotus variabilis]
MEQERPPSKWKNILDKLRNLGQISPDKTRRTILRRRYYVALISRRLTLIEIILFLIGYLWLLVLPLPRLGQRTYMDENALQPAQVNTYWNWDDVHAADNYLDHVERLRDNNITSAKRAEWLQTELGKHGISASTQNYTFSTSFGIVNGTNTYAILASPRHSGTEAIVISASWISRIGEGNGTVNVRGVSTVLALAGFLKRYSHWGKDIVFVLSDGYLEGMQAWLSSYHGTSQSGLKVDPLELTSGVIWTALNIDYSGHSFSHLGIFFEALNGRLPNQDLMNSADTIARYTAGVPVILYDHLDPEEEPAAYEAPWWLPKAIHDIKEVRSYLYQAKNVARHIGYQYNGRGSGVHGLFRQFRIDAITLYGIPAMGPHGFHAIGRTVESTLRTMNNLLERLHASFFFYLQTGPRQFLKIGLYLPSAILISVALMFRGLGTWVNAGWISANHNSKDGALSKESTWRSRKRPITGTLSVMIAMHAFGAALFALVSSSWFISNIETLAPIAFLTAFVLPLFALVIPSTKSEDVAPMHMILKTANLCLTSTVISIITLMNFSLAAVLAVVLGIPLVISSPSSKMSVRIAKYSAYALLALGWLLFAQQEIVKSVWSWQVLLVWFAPFVCIVYVPLVLQAGIVCLLQP